MEWGEIGWLPRGASCDMVRAGLGAPCTRPQNAQSWVLLSIAHRHIKPCSMGMEYRLARRRSKVSLFQVLISPSIGPHPKAQGPRQRNSKLQICGMLHLKAAQNWDPLASATCYPGVRWYRCEHYNPCGQASTGINATP